MDLDPRSTAAAASPGPCGPHRPVPRAPAPPHVPGLRLQRSLGRGAHGEVWAAVDAGSGEQVAVKLRRTASGRGPRSAGRGDVAAEAAETAERLAREIALLRRVDHPHVVRLRRVLDLPDGSRAMVLDHAAGGSLTELVRARGPLQPGEVVTLLIALARALADLHAGGIVHGDLAPGNVLFAGDGRPLLSDLGLGAVLGADQDPADWATPGFADPAGLPAGDPARDIWGLGAVAWFALTGHPPAGTLTDDPDRSLRGRGTGSGEQGFAPSGVDHVDHGVAVVSAPGQRFPVRPQRLPAPAPPTHPSAVHVGDVLQARAAARRAALLRLVRDCLAEDPTHRPDAADVGRRAWRTVPPAAIRLMARDRDTSGAVPVGSASDGSVSAPAPVSGSVSAEPEPVPATPPGGGTVVSGPWPTSGDAAVEAAIPDPVSGGPEFVHGLGADPDGSVGNDDVFLDVTRRVREAARSGSGSRPTALPRWRHRPARLTRRADRFGPDTPGPGGSQGNGPVRGGWGRRRAVGVTGLLAAALLGGGAGWAIVSRTEGITASRDGASSDAAVSRTGAVGPVSTGPAAGGGTAREAGVCLPADPSAAEFARVVCAFAHGRAEAFATASTDPLRGVDEQGSPAMAADAGLVRRLNQRGLRLDGVVFGVTGVRVQARTPDTVTVSASVTTSAHRQVRPDGTVVARVPAAAPRRTALVLVRGADGAGWRVRSTEGL
jgi:serine/threonine protein kinase